MAARGSGRPRAEGLPGHRALVQRCQWHKRENVVSYLAKREQPVWRQRLQRAYNRPEYDEALAALQSLQHELEDRNQSAAGSLAEGLDETLTLHRLGVYGVLGRSLKTTNGLESINALIEERCAKVDHWQHSSQRQRWLATARAVWDLVPQLRGGRRGDSRGDRPVGVDGDPARSFRPARRNSANSRSGTSPGTLWPSCWTARRSPRRRWSSRLGIDDGGQTVPGLCRRRTPRTSRVLTPFLRSLVERGLDVSQGLLVIVDGKGLRAAVRKAFHHRALVQREWHKLPW